MHRYCTENPDGGFYAAIASHHPDPARAFDSAARQLGTLFPDGFEAAKWLDGPVGAAFAEDVAEEMPRRESIERAIHAAIGIQIDRREI